MLCAVLHQFSFILPIWLAQHFGLPRATIQLADCAQTKRTAFRLYYATCYFITPRRAAGSAGASAVSRAALMVCAASTATIFNALHRRQKLPFTWRFPWPSSPPSLSIAQADGCAAAAFQAGGSSNIHYLPTPFIYSVVATFCLDITSCLAIHLLRENDLEPCLLHPPDFCHRYRTRCLRYNIWPAQLLPLFL